jgi:hypothetical protein
VSDLVDFVAFGRDGKATHGPAALAASDAAIKFVVLDEAPERLGLLALDTQAFTGQDAEGTIARVAAAAAGLGYTSASAAGVDGHALHRAMTDIGHAHHKVTRGIGHMRGLSELTDCLGPAKAGLRAAVLPALVVDHMSYLMRKTAKPATR